MAFPKAVLAGCEGRGHVGYQAMVNVVAVRAIWTAPGGVPGSAGTRVAVMSGSAGRRASHSARMLIAVSASAGAGPAGVDLEFLGAVAAPAGW